jgi:tRNA-Thr(GGU) m(6)t(6)A37 methyltransferase TsaA
MPEPTTPSPDDASLVLRPIGSFHADAKYAYDLPRQAVLADGRRGVIRLHPDGNFQDALRDLDGFSHIWVLFWFHRNQHWHPLVRPPCHRNRKVGVFASRAPYRPNPIGLSCVELVAINGLDLVIARHDLLDGTPILDIKPYLPYADAFPGASLGWTRDDDKARFTVNFSDKAQRQLCWLETKGLSCLRPFILNHLCYEPLNPRRHRLEAVGDDSATLAYRTWRAFFHCDRQQRSVTVLKVLSAYSDDELAASDDKYRDKELHRHYTRAQAGKDQ